MKRLSMYMFGFLVIILCAGCGWDEAVNQKEKASVATEEDQELERVKDMFQPLSDMAIPADNEMTEEKEELGKRLYFDARLSGNNKLSCMSCHAPGAGYGDNLETFIGFEGFKGSRNSPTIINAGYYDSYFWDGRASSLEEQALGPIQAAGEMNQNLDELITELHAVPEYVEEFETVFDDKITASNIAKALAAFERTIVVKDTAFDKYLLGDEDAISDDAKDGMKLFAGKAGCISCHAGAFLTDQSYHNLGMENDDGRFAVTNKEEDKGKFRTPGLRGITHTAPYMHDGSLETLDEVVAYYNSGGGTHVNKSDLVFPLELTEEEMKSLVAFLETLGGELPAVDTPEIY